MKRRPGSTPNRALRVAESLRQELAEMIRAEVKDPRVGMVTLTGVDVTPDYAFATVWFSVLPDDDAAVARSLAGLRASAGFMRSQIGRRVRIHTTPELRFQHDVSTREGMVMSQLIDVANARRAVDDPLAEPVADDDPVDDAVDDDPAADDPSTGKPV